MEVYILDSFLRRTQVIDVFESLIWTERFVESGDFKLSVSSTQETRTQLSMGTRLAINNSYRVMTIETVEDNIDDEGKAILTVSGSSLESMLDDRVARDGGADLTIEPEWIVSGTPGDVIRAMVQAVCVDGVNDLADIIPFLTLDPIFPPGTLPEPGVEISWHQEPDSLANAVRTLCNIYDLGFRMLRNFDLSQLVFEVYSGNDRTTRQTDLTPVIFAVNLDNLQNTTEFSTIEQSKNVAYVYSEAGVAVVFGDGVDPDVSGFDRRVLMVNANVAVGTPDIPGALQEAGRQALAQSRAKSYFDGELNQDSEYKYGVDYQLGDLVELRNIDGVISYKRVTEQIFVDDKEGERSYPTLALDLFVGIVSWQSYGNKPTVWLDFDLLPDTWADM